MVQGRRPGSARLQPGSDASAARLEPGAPGWRSRGYLPHFDGRDVIQHVTFHLSDSLPAEACQRIAAAISQLPDDQQERERRERLHAWIDAGHGRCLLRDPTVAAMMQGVLLHGDGSRYRLLAWVIMPNHVHALFQPLSGWPLAKIVASWKSYAGRRLSAAGADTSTGHVWHREYWDRYIRDERHFHQTVAYIHANPVAAGWCRIPSEWPWSSAAPGNATHLRGSETSRPGWSLAIPGGGFSWERHAPAWLGRTTARLEPGAPGWDVQGFKPARMRWENSGDVSPT